MATPPNRGILNKLLSELSFGPNVATVSEANITTANVTGVQTHTNASGAYINGRNVVVKTATADASAQLKSGAIYVPAGSLLRSVTVVTTTQLVRSEALALGVRVGTATNNADYTAGGIDDNGFVTSGTANVAVGVGTSSDTVLQADLGGAAALLLQNNYIATAGEVHVELQVTAGNLTSGAVAFIVEFDYVGGN